MRVNIHKSELSLDDVDPYKHIIVLWDEDGGVSILMNERYDTQTLERVKFQSINPCDLAAGNGWTCTNGVHWRDHVENIVKRGDRELHVFNDLVEFAQWILEEEEDD